MRPRIGDAPPVEIAMTSGLAIDDRGHDEVAEARPVGDVDQCAGAFRRRPSLGRKRSSSVATKQSAAPSKSVGSGSRASWRKFG